MDENEAECKSTTSGNISATKDSNSANSKGINRGKKRKRYLIILNYDDTI